MSSKKISNIIPHCFSFFLTVIVLFFAFYLNGIYPGSEKSILIYDMGAQYVSFFSYLHNIGEGCNSLMFQTLSALGGGYFGSWAYYTASPLSWLIILFDQSDIQTGIYFLTILKISLCALSFSIYLRFGRFKKIKSVWLVVTSVSYALMSYNIMYSMCLMWLDGVIMLPLVILGAEYIMAGKKKLLFCVSLSLSIIFNYYTGYMIILFVIVYFVYYIICFRIDHKRIFKLAIDFMISGTVSILMASIILIPVIYDLSKGRLVEEQYELSGLLRNPLVVLRQLFPLPFVGFSPVDAPPVYCGILVTASVVFYFVSKKVSKRNKIALISVIIIFLLSFCFDTFDIIWHGMQMPVSFPARYSFIFSFFLLTVFADVVERLSDETFSDKFKTVIKYIVPLLLVLDLGLNSYYVIDSLDNDQTTGGYLKTIRYDYYYRIYNDLKDELSSDSRIVSDLDCSSDDGLLFGLSSLDYFSSSYDHNLSWFYKQLGLNTVRHNFEDVGLNPLSASLLGVDYFVPFLAEYNINEYRNDLKDFFNPTELQSGMTIYENPYSLPFISAVNETDSSEFSYNAFENLNKYCEDLTGISNVFVECDKEVKACETINEGTLVKNIFSIQPLSNSHLYFYVSSEDYETEDGYCYDYLFIGDQLIASYENYGYRYIVDLGVSDGSPLEFTFVSASDVSEVWFYSFDESAYNEAMNMIDHDAMINTVYNRSGIESEVYISEDTDALMLLPCDDGIKIFIDGELVNYDSYKNALIKLHIPAGNHRILVKYHTPGLIAGSLISLLTMLCLILGNVLNKKKLIKKCVENEDQKAV